MRALKRYTDPKTGEVKEKVPIGSVDFCLTPDKCVSVAWAFAHAGGTGGDLSGAPGRGARHDALHRAPHRPCQQGRGRQGRLRSRASRLGQLRPLHLPPDAVGGEGGERQARHGIGADPSRGRSGPAHAFHGDERRVLRERPGRLDRTSTGWKASSRSPARCIRRISPPTCAASAPRWCWTRTPDRRG